MMDNYDDVMDGTREGITVSIQNVYDLNCKQY